MWTALLYLPIETLFFHPAVEAFQAPENQSKDQHCRALSRGWLGISSLFVLLRCCTASGTFLSFWPFIFPSSYCRKAFEGVLCFAQKVFISRKLQVSTLEDWQGVGAHAYCSYIPDSFNSARLHRGNILLPILGSAWPGSQLQHSNMLKSKMHMP